jgi:NAD-dependent dihydropyrimidine dehydrogenase PreA subunit
MVAREVWRLEELFVEFQNTDNLIVWLARRCLLRNENLCHVCGIMMTLCQDAKAIDGKIWICSRCNLNLSIL